MAVLAALGTAVLGGVVGYVAHVFKSRVPTQDNQDTIDHQKRQEALDHFRWAAELAVSSDEAKRSLGAGQLKGLTSNAALNDDDIRMVRRAIHSALAPKLRTWDTESEVETEEGD